MPNSLIIYAGMTSVAGSLSLAASRAVIWYFGASMHSALHASRLTALRRIRRGLLVALGEEFVGLLVIEVRLEAAHITACRGELGEWEQGNPEDGEVTPGADKRMIGSLLALVTAVLQLTQDCVARAIARDDRSSVVLVSWLARACSMIVGASMRG